MKIAVIGFGEAGQAISEGLRSSKKVSIATWDKLFLTSNATKVLRAASELDVIAARSLQEAVDGATIIMSLVTADCCLEAAQQAAALLDHRQLFLDMNSVAPTTKRNACRVFDYPERFLDVAIIGPVKPRLHGTPMLVAGKSAPEAVTIMKDLGMSVIDTGANVGDAAAVKMIRGVLIKGIEALTAECLMAAEAAGVYSVVVSSLSENYPEIDWFARVSYNLERLATHGLRRGHELQEIAETLTSLGVEPILTEAAAQRQFRGGRLALTAPMTGDPCLDGRDLARQLGCKDPEQS